EALGGGTVDLGGLTTMTANIDLEADGAGSTLKVPALASFSVGSTFIAGGARLTAQDGGGVESGHLTAMNHVLVRGLGGILELPAGNLTMPSTGSGNIVNVLTLSTGLPIDLGTHGTLVGTTFNIPQGDQVALSAGTYVSAAFNLGQGATLDLTGGQTVTYSGTLAASGNGPVQLSSGLLAVGLGGLRVNFAGAQFQWTGGWINGAAGPLTNEGTINLSGSGDKLLFDDATLDNFGTLIQT